MSALCLQARARLQMEQALLQRTSSDEEHQPGPPSVHLFVGNIGQSVTEADLNFWFSQFGKVISAKVSASCTSSASHSLRYTSYLGCVALISCWQHLLPCCTMPTYSSVWAHSSAKAV
jgi:hypothetical protein